MLFTQAFAKEVGAHKINVNCVCPGTIDTPLLRGAGSGLNITEEQFLQGHQGACCRRSRSAASAIPPTSRRSITFLASDEADYMTGQAINISGGQEMH